MPTMDGCSVAFQETVPPGGMTRGSVTASPSGASAGSLPWASSPNSVRLLSGYGEDRNWTDSPCCAAAVPFLTVPVTVTVRPGAAHCGLTDLMRTDSWRPGCDACPRACRL